MVTQILFGETVQIISETSKWYQVILEEDGYQGWVDKKMIEIISSSEYSNITSLPAICLSDPIIKVRSKKTDSGFTLPAGSIIRNFRKETKEFGWNDNIFSMENDPVFHKKITRETIVHTAMQFLNSPYLWGGKTCFGIDCSGFTQLVMKINRISIPRDARLQVGKGTTQSFISESQPGDLAFFDNEEGEIIHTGIILANNEIIHASGKVQVDRVDQQGIFNTRLNHYSHKLRIIKSYLE